MIVISVIPNNTRERIVLNLLRLNDGGGRQNALSFVAALGKDKENKSRCVALVTHGTPLHKACNSIDMETIVVPDNSAYLLYEYFYGRQLLKGQLCFGIFGFPLPMSVGRAVNVSGCALSNLFYPEIDFWKYLPRVKYHYKQLKDYYRRTRVAQADFWIFETETLRERAISICDFPEERVEVVPMAPSELVSSERVNMEDFNIFKKLMPDKFKILFLNGAHPNKRMHLLPSLARSLVSRDQKDFCFITTMPDQDKYSKYVFNQMKDSNLEKHIVNVGPVKATQVASLIAAIDTMCTFSLLESFSNNFVEAWKMKKPLIATDADWACHSCGKGACYVDPTAPEKAAEVIDDLIRNDKLRGQLIKYGGLELAKYPNAKQKNALYFECIEKAICLGKCPNDERNKIKWPKIQKNNNNE